MKSKLTILEMMYSIQLAADVHSCKHRLPVVDVIRRYFKGKYTEAEIEADYNYFVLGNEP